MTPQRIRVEGDNPYDVVVGAGSLAELPSLVGPGVRRVAVMYQAAVESVATHAQTLLDPAIETVGIQVPEAEAGKSAEVLAKAWDALGAHKFTRSDLVIGVGGGAATDLAGFTAATWLRGVDVVHVPTTLLGMVDAAVGGKTGINIAAGKNLVGAFHPPSGVLCDLSVLDTLPTADYAAGMAEVVKAGFIADPAILDLIDADLAGARSPHGPHTSELITRAIAVKAAVVAGDLRERGGAGPGGIGREILNYGHTLGHAIEKRERYRWRHGDAISVGLVFAAALSRLAAGLDVATERRHRDVLAALGLPTHYDVGAWSDLRDAMSIDKKARGRTLRFVVLEALGAARILADPDSKLLDAAYAEVAK